MASNKIHNELQTGKDRNFSTQQFNRSSDISSSSLNQQSKQTTGRVWPIGGDIKHPIVLGIYPNLGRELDVGRYWQKPSNQKGHLVDSRGTKGRNPDMDNGQIIQTENERQTYQAWGGSYFCKKTDLRLAGSFWEKSPAASSFQAEMLGLCSLHLLVRAFAEYHNVETWSAVMSCDNKWALELSLHHKKMIQPSAKYADIRQSFCATKQTY